jgi:acyl CoA:acetate/3-ketoacid CoA transferase beta subunit
VVQVVAVGEKVRGTGEAGADPDARILRVRLQVRREGMGGAMGLVHGAKLVIVLMEHVARDGSYKIVNELSLAYNGRRTVNRITDRCRSACVPGMTR